MRVWVWICWPCRRGKPPLLLSDQSIDITTNFRGTEIILMTYLSEPDPNARLIITGPSGTLTLRRKERVAGLWIVPPTLPLPMPTYVACKVLIASSCCAIAAVGLSALYRPSTELSGLICRHAFRELMADKGSQVGASIALAFGAGVLSHPCLPACHGQAWGL